MRSGDTSTSSWFDREPDLEPDLPGGPDTPPDYAPPAYGATPPDRGEPSAGGNRSSFVLVAVALLAVGGLLGLYLLTRGDDTATDTASQSSVTAAPVTGSTAADSTSTIAPPSTGDPAVTAPPGTDTAATGDGSTSTMSPEGAELVNAFRQKLRDNRLTSDRLSDNDIQNFATSFCIFARQSTDADAFAVFRDQAINETTSQLDQESLNTVIDVAIVTFCPEEAARLGITA